MKSEQIQQRIETYTASLPQAVQAPNGASFAMLLSLIASNQEIYTPTAAAVTGEDQFALAPEPPLYPDPGELNTGEVVERLNQAINRDQPGEYAYLVSYLDTRAHMPRQSTAANDRFQQVALASSGRMMLEVIDQSRRAFHATA